MQAQIFAMGPPMDWPVCASGSKDVFSQVYGNKVHMYKVMGAHLADLSYFDTP